MGRGLNYLSKAIILASAAALILVGASGCWGGDSSESDEETTELEVVVFSTEAPTLVPTATLTPTPASSPTAGPDAVALASGDTVAASSAINRPADVNPLTGLKVDDEALLRRRPLLVRVGNDPVARPQVGLNEADLVYEELVEWWVTRFTAIFLSQDPKVIGPVRSARLINLPLTSQYQGALANSGGSDPVRWELSQSDIVNLDEFFVPQPYFYRENEGWQTRLAFDATEARDYMQAEDLESDVGLRGFFFAEKLDADDLPKEAVAEADEVVIPYPARTSEAKWTYDAASGRYLRFTTGEPMLDAAGRRISAANVIIYFAEHQETDIVEDSNGATSVRIIIDGRGPAWLLRDGQVLKGFWETNGRETPNFLFENGRPMPLKPGNTWVQVVPLEYVIDIDGAAHEVERASPGNNLQPTEASSTKPAAAGTPTATPIGARAQTTPQAN